MEGLRIFLFGGFDARLPTGRALGLTARKAQALLAYLAHRPGQHHSREKLATLLWGDAPAERARHSLRQALLALRQDLGQEGAVSALIEEAQTVTLNPLAVEVDVSAFERLVAEGTPTTLEQAMALYRGDLLEGLGVQEAPFEEWLLSERERLRELAQEGLARLLAHRMKSGLVDDAIRVALRLLALDPTQESVHRALMGLYARQGRRGAALRQYQACVRTLQRELGAEPEPDTRQLYREILQQRPAAAGTAPGGRPDVGLRPDALTAETPLIGREAEIARLGELLVAARQGRGGLVLVRGEAGVGKSRLLMELAARAALGGPVLIGRSYETQQALPFGPWVDALRGGRVTRATVPSALDPVWRGELARLLPELGHPAPPAPPGPEQSVRLFEAVAHLLEALAALEPLLLILEDLQWADEMSVRLLGFLARRLAGAPALLVATLREEDLDDAPLVCGLVDDLARDGRVTLLPIAPLSREGTADLVRALGRRGSDAAQVERLAARIWTASGGHPFTVVEMMRTRPQDWTPVADGDLALPEGVHALVARRLARLSPRAQDALAVAAAIGRAFEFELLGRAADLTPREAAESIEELVRRRVLQGVGERFEFTHDRIRAVVYGGLIEPRRVALHAAVADSLEALYADRLDEVREPLAFHHARAGQTERAIHHLLQVADQAARVYAYARAAEALGEVADSLRRTASPDVDRRVLEIVLRQAFFLSTLGRFAEVRELLAGERERLERLGDPALIGPYFFRVGLTHQNLGDFEAAVTGAEQALEAARRAGDGPTAGRALYLRALASYYLGRPAEGVEDARRAIELLAPPAEPHWLGLAHWIAALLHTMLGRFAEALTHVAAVTEIGAATADPRLQSFAAWVRAIALSGRGEHAAALQEGQRALEVASDPFSRAVASAWLGWAHLEAGAAGAAVPLLERAVGDLGRLGVRHTAGRSAATLGEALLLAGRPDVARDRALEGLAVCREMNYACGTAIAERVLGRIALANGALADARGYLEGALARFTSVGADYEAARTRRLLAELTAPS
jgi:DNA-binding SARP family transcriptional activator